MWVFMSVEVVTFGLFLLGHAWSWRGDPVAFAASQAMLHPASGVRGTFFLLLGSGLAYQGVLAQQANRRSASAKWMALAATAGSLFCINKVIEYADPALAEVTLSTNAFWFSYLFLTGLHLFHVVGGVIVLGWLAWRAGWSASGPVELGTAEAGAAYWHLVDIIWVLLFPIIYLMHP